MVLSHVHSPESYIMAHSKSVHIGSMCVPLAALACQLETCMEYPGSGNVGLTAMPCWKWQFWFSYTHYIPTNIYIYNTYTHYIIYPSYTHYLSILILPFDVPFDIPHVKIPMTHRRGDRLWEPGVLREQLRATEFPSRLDLRSPGRRGVSEQWLDVVRNLMAGDEGFMMFMIDIRYGEGFGIFVFKIFIQIVLLLSFICWSLS